MTGERAMKVSLAIVIIAVFAVLIHGWVKGQVEAYREWLQQPIVEGFPPPPNSVDVRRGDTLWGIAAEFYPKDKYDLRKVVWVIREMNPDIDPGRLQPGKDTIYLPRFEDL